MKKILVLSLMMSGVVLFSLLHSCRHEIPTDPCTSDPILISTQKTDASPNLNNGIIRATATGGSGFRYSLNGNAFQDSGSFYNLPPYLDYTIVVKNSWGCTDTAHVPIGLNDPCAGVTITVATTKTDATVGQTNGAITATASGATGFTYSKDGVNFQASGSFTGLASGNYTITAKSSAGCTGSAQVTVGSFNPCAGVTITVATTQVNPTTGQSNGSITATASGSTGFTYSLNGGAYQASGTFTGLATGNYTVTAKNSNGCTGVAQVALGSTNPCSGVTITVALAKTDPATGQSNGSITATASGGSGYTYSLNNGTYQASNVFSGLAAGTYTVTAKTSAGCLGSNTITLTATNPCSSTNIVLATTVVGNTPCAASNTGSITVNASGSTGFTYSLNGGAYQAGNVFTGLAANTFNVTAKDLNGCTKTVAVVVANVASGPLFAAVRTLITNRCGGSGCHLNGGSPKGYNFDADCSIVTYWSQINKTAVTYTMTKMPINPQPLLTTAEKATITAWINAGHLYSN